MGVLNDHSMLINEKTLFIKDCSLKIIISVYEAPAEVEKWPVTF